MRVTDECWPTQFIISSPGKLLLSLDFSSPLLQTSPLTWLLLSPLANFSSHLPHLASPLILFYSIMSSTLRLPQQRPCHPHSSTIYVIKLWTKQPNFEFIYFIISSIIITGLSKPYWFIGPFKLCPCIWSMVLLGV